MTALFDDLDASVAEAVAALRTVQDQDWTRLAGTLTWSCWETVEHVADDLFAYAAQVGVTTPETSTYVPFVFTRTRPDAPALTVRADPERGNAGLVQVLDACGGFLSGVTHTASPEARGWHPYGVSDPAGFAAMGSVEVLLHLHDLSMTLGFAWTPPAPRVVRLLERLFPDLRCEGDPWATMLRATGRDPRVPVDDWRWDGTVR